MDTHDPRAVAALQAAFLEGRADSSLLTSLSREQNAAAGTTPAAALRPPERRAGDRAAGKRDPGPAGDLRLEREADRRVVRRERRVAFIERRPVARAVRRLHAGRLLAAEPGRHEERRDGAGAA
ncbi:hypothetical protein ACIA8K_36690 [Catenuloplanes sp. NPDC051500]|uniref:hypothetical protein n=1 Tax=Catenuloplanes sp. NPDC051500 TaxID=3363959 RepID=UPI0037B4F0B7